jgi:hypothetical protein
MDIRQIPDEIRTHHVRHGVVVAKQLVGQRLIGPECIRPIGAVLQPDAGLLRVREAHRVVEAERHAVLEAPLERHLDRVIRPPAAVPLLRDGGIAAHGAHQIGLHGGGARRGTGADL